MFFSNILPLPHVLPDSFLLPTHLTLSSFSKNQKLSPTTKPLNQEKRNPPQKKDQKRTNKTKPKSVIN